MTSRKCSHPAGCELVAAPGSIYCEGCETDPTLEPGPRCEHPDEDFQLAPDSANDHGSGSYYFYDERD